MNRIILVSNRLPIKIEKKGQNFKFHPSIGGVATGLNSLSNSYEHIWVGWPGITKDKLKNVEKNIKGELISKNLYPIFLTPREVDRYYNGFCNKTIWPLFHYFTQSAIYDCKMWENYKQVNQEFCDAVIKIARKDDIIWVHDYHLLLLPQMIRDKLPEAKIGFFLHIPFPSSEIFRLLPWRNQILEGLMGADLIGVHTYDYAQHLLHSILRVFGYEHEFGQIKIDERYVKVDTFPMGIDYDKFADTAVTPEVEKEIKKIRNRLGERKIILSIDRLDYTKGIPARLQGFDYFLEKNPEFKEKVTLILVAVPSRTKVEHYRQLKKKIEEMISKINGKHGTIGWTPVWYLYRVLPFETLLALYNISDIGLITPLRDGMNLMAKEFIATKGDETGILILSEMAGAAAELGEALIINPNNKEDIAGSIKEALTMPEDEQKKRNRIMQQRLKRYDINRWVNEFLDKLVHETEPNMHMHVNLLTKEFKNDLIKKYFDSKERLIILDYDGTLVPFAEQPDMAKPNNEVINVLKQLTYEKKNEVVIVSGRDKGTLEDWFSGLEMNLVAEHGAWIKEKGSKWKTLKGLKSDWKDEVKPFLEQFVDRTPGSFIEEKDYSLAWHYRKADLKLGLVRALELKYALTYLSSNLNLEILEGSKVIEVRNTGVNKGMGTMDLVNKNNWDYILAIGDDVTDEDLFDMLPEHAHSIKVGLKPSRAKFNLGSVMDINKFLKELK